MTRPSTPVLALIGTLSLAFLPAPAAAQQPGTPIGFLEEFALAEDRAVTLQSLVPGTDEHFFFRCLERQHAGATADVDALLTDWRKRHGETPRYREIELRQVFLKYPAEADASRKALIERLGLKFDHRRPQDRASPDLPTRLDPGTLSPAALVRRALERSSTLSGFREHALIRLAGTRLDERERRDLLERLRVPDLPNLPQLVVDDLRSSGGFGRRTVHRLMTLAQLEACAQLEPELLANETFVQTWLARLVPGPDVPWRTDPAAKGAYLDRLLRFVARLGPAFNSLRAHVLYHELALELEQGRVDAGLLRNYLQLPRTFAYVEPRVYRVSGVPRVEPSRVYPTGLPAIGNDEDLVRRCLAVLLVDAGNDQAWRGLVRDEWLRRLFVETKVLAGVGDPARWLQLVDDPAWVEALRERVEIRFPTPRRTAYAPDDPFVLDVETKNVTSLLVKVFEIDTYNYCLATEKNVDASIDLDGLVANSSRTLEIEDAPLRRQARELEFPEIRGKGVWIVELLGNGIASRAVVRKGSLRVAERVGAAGHVFEVFDQDGDRLTGATIRFGGRRYDADEEGEILIPFATSPGRKSILVRHDGLTVVDDFVHRGEDYELRATAVVDREALVPGRTARIVVRPHLLVAGTTADPDVLRDVVLQIRATDRRGTTSNLDVRGAALEKAGGLRLGGELVHEIRVPNDLSRLDVSLSAKVDRTDGGDPVTMTAAAGTFEINRIEATPAVAGTTLGRTQEGYVLDVLGKDGEPRPDTVVDVKLVLRDFTDDLEIRMRTDARGRIVLGPLPGVLRVDANRPATADGVPPDGSWPIDERFVRVPPRVTVPLGTPVVLPYAGSATTATRTAFALMRRTSAGEGFDVDAFGALSVNPGFVTARPGEPGRYRLVLRETGQSCTIDVVAGERNGAWVQSPTRMVRASDGFDTGLQVASVEPGEDVVTVRLAGADPTTRVHVVATRYLPPFDLVRLALPGGPARAWSVHELAFADTTYHSGREIGDEYRYILDRRAAPRFAGVMLPRPGLILNPWELDETETQIGLGGGSGGRFGGRGRGAASDAAPEGAAGRAGAGRHPRTFVNFAFLPEGSRILTNLEPEADGTVRVPRADLGPGQQLHVLAVSATREAYASTAVAETPLEPAPRRLLSGLDPSRALAEQRRIEFVPADGSATLEDVRTAKIATLDSLASVYGLFRALRGDDAELPKFEFVLRWPALTPQEKLAKYSEFACHELNLFVYFKDRTFFDEFVAPYLANKVHRTFVDEWLLGADLTGYLDPWAFERLNTFERILLARRIGGDRAAAIARRIDDAVSLQPQDPVEQTRIFLGVLGSDDLSQARGALLALEEKAADLKLETRTAAERLRRRGRDFARNQAQAGQPSGPAAPSARAGGRPSDPSSPGAPPPDRGVAADAEEPEEAVERLDDARREVQSRAKSLFGQVSGGLADMDKDGARRNDVRQLFRDTAATRRLVEQNYWHTDFRADGPGLVPENRFWNDWADAPSDRPFVSTHVADAAGSFASMMLALAVLDLPFEPNEPETVADGAELTIRPSDPLLLVRQEITDAERVVDAPILVSQNVYRLDRRYVTVDGQRQDAWVTDEYLVGVAYGCQVVVTNPTSTPRPVDLLLQVPEGAIPVRNTLQTRSVPMTVGAYSTQSLDYAFYFPRPGSFRHYPVHVAESFSARILGRAEAIAFEVVTDPSSVDESTWEFIAYNGSLDEVVAYLRGANLGSTDLGRIAWRMQDEAAFDAVVATLRARQFPDVTLWSYGFLHADVGTMRETLRFSDDLLRQCGPALASPLLDVDPVEREWYRHVEFAPLVNGRAHRFGDERRILNAAFAQQYLAYLDVLAHRPRLDDLDWLGVTYYMMLQDRMADALDAFAKVDPAGVEGARLQYDAIRAWLAFPRGDADTARRIAETYANHPIERWRTTFREMIRQLDEAEGVTGDAEDDGGAAGRADLAATEPALEMSLESLAGPDGERTRAVRLDYANLEAVEMRFFLMDVEFLFSTRPFADQGSDAFSYIRPNRVETVALPQDRNGLQVPLPAAFDGRNVLVEVRAAGIVRRQPAYANDLAVRWIENRGQLRVADPASDRPLAKVYIKVFRRGADGKAVFHKDGYTDLRGRFDYVSLSGFSAASAAKYAVLVLDEERGAVIRELGPPAQ